MNNKQFKLLAQEYESYNQQIKELEKSKDYIKKQMLKVMGDKEDYSHAGAKCIVTTSQREMYIKAKLIEKFGEDKLKDCIKTTPFVTVRITYKEE